MFPKWFQYKCNSQWCLQRRKIGNPMAILAFWNVFFFIFTLFFTLSGWAKFKQPHPNFLKLPTLLQEVEDLYAKSATLSADFSQINDNHSLGQQKKSTGKIFVKRPSKIRWETAQPDVSLFISDGVHSWFYTPPFEQDDRGQLIQRKTSKIQSQLTHALLSGSFSMARQMKIVQKSASTFLLIPKKDSAGSVREATIVVNPDQKWIQKVTLEHEGGNRSEITLTHIQLATPLRDDLFTFHAPPNTDQVDDPDAG